MTERRELNLRRLALEALEACRVEVVRRLQLKGLQTKMTVNRLAIIEDPPEAGQTGWRSTWVSLPASSLHADGVSVAIRDEESDSVPLVDLGFKRQLMPLACALARVGSLAGRSNMELPEGYDWAATPEMIISRYLAGFARAYLAGLPDLQTGDPDLASRFVSELEALVNSSTISRTDHVLLDGCRVESPIRHRDVALRPLTPLERGRYWEFHGPQFGRHAFVDEVVLPTTLAVSVPRTLLEVTTHRDWNTSPLQGGLVNRVALGLFLGGYPLSGPGIMTSFDNPRWAWFGATSHPPSLVQVKMSYDHPVVSTEDFHTAVDLAYRMPYFESETDHKQIALRRLLRGLGAAWTESGFLDYAIALEAALLQGMTTELKYRFSLYGSLFLKEIRDPSITFRDLKLIYDIRSSLVHGNKIDPASLASATASAAEIARLIARKAIVSGWPNPKLLDRAALD